MLTRSTVSATALLATLLGCLAAPAAAQLKVDPAEWNANHTGIKLRTEETVDLHTTTPPPIDPYAYRRGLFTAMGLYEYKPVGAVEGQYTRPHYALGFHSDLMKDALSLTGLDAESCIAPMLRVRARQTTVTGATGVSASVFARCTFR